MGMLHKVEEFWMKISLDDKLNGEWDMHRAGDLVMCLSNHNGHVGRHVDGFVGMNFMV